MDCRGKFCIYIYLHIFYFGTRANAGTGVAVAGRGRRAVLLAVAGCRAGSGVCARRETETPDSFVTGGVPVAQKGNGKPQNFGRHN